MAKLEVGEKYLVIQIVGHEKIVAYPNKKRLNENHPAFKSDGVAVWVNEKRAEKPKPQGLDKKAYDELGVVHVK